MGRPRSPCWILVFTALGSPACVNVEGGAAELSWALFNRAGKKVPCSGDDESGNVSDVRLCWTPVAPGEPLDPTCRAPTQETFACPEGHGVTGFDLAAGRTAFWVVPVCASGAVPDAAMFQTPAPIVREVVEGEVVTLSALAIVIGSSEEELPTCVEVRAD
jgi:hypothetical protein